VEYQIGEPDKTIVTGANQIEQGGGEATAFCLKRVAYAYTIADGDVSLFKNTYDTDGILILSQNYNIADAKEIPITLKYKLDSTLMDPEVKVSFKITAKAVCGTPTATVPAAQSSTPSLYVGRTQTVEYPAWTLNPSFCQHGFVIDMTANGGFGSTDTAAKFTVSTVSSVRTIGIASGTSFTEDEKKEYTIPIEAAYPTSDGTKFANLKYNFKFKLEADPCVADSPTQVAVTANE